MSYSTASAILKGKWLIEKQFAASQLPVIAKIMKGEAFDFGLPKKVANQKPTRMAGVTAAVYHIDPDMSAGYLPAGSIALVNVVGPVLKYGDLCSYGSIEKTALINDLANTTNVSAIILNVDSPGGEAAGTAMLADALKAAAEKKPVIGFVNDGIAASAAMWVISACNEIYCSQPTDAVGSIGAYQTLADWYGYFESKGLKVRDVYAPQSVSKNDFYREAISGNDKLMKEDLKMLVDAFIGAVETNRAGKLTSNDWKTGKMYDTRAALKIGLIDGQKSFNEVVQRAQKLIVESKTVGLPGTTATRGQNAKAATAPPTPAAANPAMEMQFQKDLFALL